MYQRLDGNKHLTDEFRGVHEFLQYVISQEKFTKQGEMLRCPCVECNCKIFKYMDEVGLNIYELGFMPSYYWWTNHGEDVPIFPPVDTQGSSYGTCEQREELGYFQQMIMDHVGPSTAHYLQAEPTIGPEHMKENFSCETQKFFDMFVAVQAPLWEGCQNHSQLSVCLEALSLKSDYNVSEGCFNRMVQLMGETMPKYNRMVTTFSQAKKSVKTLGLGCMKIDCCPKGCMLYYNEIVIKA